MSKKDDIRAAQEIVDQLKDAIREDSSGNADSVFQQLIDLPREGGGCIKIEVRDGMVPIETVGLILEAWVKSHEAKKSEPQAYTMEQLRNSPNARPIEAHRNPDNKLYIRGLDLHDTEEISTITNPEKDGITIRWDAHYRALVLYLSVGSKPCYVPLWVIAAQLDIPLSEWVNAIETANEN